MFTWRSLLWPVMAKDLNTFVAIIRERSIQKVVVHVVQLRRPMLRTPAVGAEFIATDSKGRRILLKEWYSSGWMGVTRAAFELAPYIGAAIALRTVELRALLLKELVQGLEVLIEGANGPVSEELMQTAAGIVEHLEREDTNPLYFPPVSAAQHENV